MSARINHIPRLTVTALRHDRDLLARIPPTETIGFIVFG